MTQFATEKLVPGAAEPAPGATPTTIRLCYQLGFGKLDTESVMTLVTVPTTPAILIQCAIVELSNCKSSLDAILGTTWTGRIYAVSIYRWSDGSGKLVDDPPQAADLIQAAAGLAQPLHETKGADHLVEVSMLLVAPAPTGMTDADLQAKLTPPPGSSSPTTAPPVATPER
jgi:hypothetical protein